MEKIPKSQQEKKNPSRKRNAGSLTIPHHKLYSKAIGMQHGTNIKADAQWNAKGDLEMKLQRLRHLIFN